MKSAQSIFILVLLFTLILSTTLFAQQSKSLTLEQAMTIAFQRNVSVAQAQNSVESSKLSVLSSYGAYIPVVGASASWQRSGVNTPATTQFINGIPFPIPERDEWLGQYNASIGLSYTIFDGFRREVNLDNSKSGQLQSEQSFERTKQQIGYSVQSLYLNVLRSEQLMKVSEENLTNEQKRLERIMEMNRVGAIAIGDVYRQQSSVASSEYNLINAQSTFKKAKADLLNILALDVNEEYTIADEALVSQIQTVETDPGIETLGTFGSLMGRALDSRFDYLNSKEALIVAENNITSTWSDYYPTLSTYATIRSSTPLFKDVIDKRSYSYGLTMSWRMPEIFSSYQRIEGAKISKSNAELQLEQKVRDISVEMKKALLDLDAARKQYEVSQKNVLAAGQDRRVAEEKYNLGSGTLLDYQVANTAYMNAQVTKVNNAYSYLMFKRNLELVIGEKKY
ncbi:MAG: TolC family protein [bacterium]